MQLKEYTYPKALDFHPFVDELEKKYGFYFRDMAGKYSKGSLDKQKTHKQQWMEDNGFGGKEYVLDKPEGQQEDWSKDSPEIALRIEINTKYRRQDDLIPYQDVWHWLLDNDFCELRRGGLNYLNLLDNIEEESTPEFVKTFLRAVLEEVKDHPEYYDGESVSFHVDW